MSNQARIAATEVRYLARVGAYRYLDAPRAALCAQWSNFRVPSVPEDRELVSRPSTYEGGTPRRLRSNHAFTVYEAAEKAALNALAEVDEDEDLEVVIDALKVGLEEGERVRAGLLRKRQQIPGRGQWLIPAAWALSGSMSALEPRTAIAA